MASDTSTPLLPLFQVVRDETDPEYIAAQIRDWEFKCFLYARYNEKYLPVVEEQLAYWQERGRALLARGLAAQRQRLAPSEQTTEPPAA